MEAGSTSRSGRTAPRGLGRPTDTKRGPSEQQCSKALLFSRSSPAGPSTTIQQRGGIPLWLDSWIFPQSKYGIISLTAEAECQGYVFSLFLLPTWMCETSYNQKNVKWLPNTLTKSQLACFLLRTILEYEVRPNPDQLVLFVSTISC